MLKSILARYFRFCRLLTTSARSKFRETAKLKDWRWSFGRNGFRLRRYTPSAGFSRRSGGARPGLGNQAKFRSSASLAFPPFSTRGLGECRTSVALRSFAVDIHDYDVDLGFPEHKAYSPEYAQNSFHDFVFDITNTITINDGSFVLLDNFSTFHARVDQRDESQFLILEGDSWRAEIDEFKLVEL